MAFKSTVKIIIESDNPTITANKLRLLLLPERASKIGSTDTTQGAKIVSTPAMNDTSSSSTISFPVLLHPIYLYRTPPILPFGLR